MTIGVGYLLDGKKPCLYYYRKDNEIVKLATFISERQAKEFLEVLRKGLTEVRVDISLEGEE